MRFKGQLLVPSEPGPGLRVDLEVAGHHLAVGSDSGELGAWPLETVTVRRLEGDTFEMTVAGEDLHFIADDTISFAYSGMPAIERFSSHSPSRSRIRNFLGRLGSNPTAPRLAAPAPLLEEADVATEPPPIEPEETTWPDDPSNESVVGPAIDEVIDMDALSTEEPDTEELMAPAPTVAPTPGVFPQPWSDAAQDAEVDCPAFTSEGLPCQSPILAPSGYCYSHDPERSFADGYRKAQEARARLKRKGTARLNKVYGRLEKAMRQVERGELEPNVAMAMAQLARTMCAILDLDEDGNQRSPETTESDS